jgi:hypothetical protein
MNPLRVRCLSASLSLPNRLNFYAFILFVAFLLPESAHAQAVTFAGTTPSVNFGKVNVCVAGKDIPGPCSAMLTLTYKVTSSGTLGTPEVVTGGQPNLDFTLASGSTCTGSVTVGTTCVVKATFTPKYPGQRPGGVLITDGSGKVLATTLIYGFGIGAQIEFGSPVSTPISGPEPSYFTVDGAGDLFGVDYNNSQVVELPLGAMSPIVLPFTGLHEPGGVAADGAGNVYVSDDNNAGASMSRVVELPAGGGAQITLPITGLEYPTNLAVDGAGDVFVADLLGPEGVVELPAGGSQISLPFTNEDGFVTIDGLGDVFATGYTNSYVILELPANGGPELTITGPFTNPLSIPVDPAANGSGFIFFSNATDGNLPGQIVEMPASKGPAVTLASSLDLGFSLDAVDSAGNLYAIQAYQHGNGPDIFDRFQLSQSTPLLFATTAIESTTILPLTISDIGTATLTLAPAFDNSSYRIVSMQPENCLASISPGGICTLQIGFTPHTGGSQNGVLRLTSNTATDPAIQLQGEATGVVAPVMSPPSGVYTSAQTVSITEGTSGAVVYYTTNGTLPTASSKTYSGPIPVTGTERITAIAIQAGHTSAVSTAAYTIMAGKPGGVIDYSSGFTQTGMQLNGATTLDGARLELTDGGGSEEGSAFYTTPVNVTAFSTDFAFQLRNAVADGITFTIQNTATTAQGGVGGSLGYTGIGKSVAVKFDLFNNDGESTDSTGLYTGGVAPTIPAVGLTGSGINLHNGDIVLAQIAYDGTTLVLTLTDTSTLATYSHSFAINIPVVVGGDTAYVGFTGGTGGLTAIQEIVSWTYVAGTPGAAAPPPPIPAAPGFSNGFTSLGTVTNGSSTFSGTSLELTDGNEVEAASAFYAAPVNIQSFTTDFRFQLSSPGVSVPLSNIADGFTFTIQNAGLGALGDFGGSLGYAPSVGRSVAIKFDLHDNAGEGPDSTGLFVDGMMPTVPAITLTGTGINLHSGDPFTAQLNYNGTSLKLTLTDTVTLATWSHSFTVDIPTVVGRNTAFVGFTGGTGGAGAVQDILNWSFTNP